MSVRIDSRSYTNAMLTVIAVFLCALTLHTYRVSVAQDAQAQPVSSIGTQQKDGFSPGGVAAPNDLQNVPKTQDVAVAGATLEVARANREIAVALNGVAKAIEGVGRDVARSNAPAAAAPAPVSSGGSMRSTGTSGAETGSVSVERSR